MTTANPVRRLAQLGQSVWLDHIERGFVTGGELGRLIADDGVSGVTSNPAIFQKAFADSPLYRDSIRKLARDRLSALEIQEALIIQDIRAAADVLADVHSRSNAVDGYVSLEVSPHLARDALGTCEEAKRLWTLVDRRNLMIKVPGTAEGLVAVRRLIADGINVNVTLLFDVDRYAHIAEAFISGLEARAAAGHQLVGVASVASFFLSRIDTIVDARIEATGDPEVAGLRGQVAIACARAAYQHYSSVFSGSRWQSLVARGAIHSQRLLWASTGTKDPTYSDVKYVEALIAPQTITTVPPETLAAYRDHGHPEVRLSPPAASARQDLDGMVHRLAAAGIEWDTIAAELEEQGIRKFVEPYDAALTTLQARIAEVGT